MTTITSPEISTNNRIVPGDFTPSTADNTSPAGTGVNSSDLDHEITTRWLLKFALPTILSWMIFSAFGTVDGVFAARIIGPEALAAVGVVWPFLAFVMAIGFMLSIGGSALVGKKIGEGKHTEARGIFTMLTLVTVIASALIALFALLFPNALLGILGVDEFLRPLATAYLGPLAGLLPAVMLGFFIQQYFITEGKPNLGLYVTLAGGLINLGLNFLLIAHLQWGLRGAAISTGIGYIIPAVIGTWFFLRNRTGSLYFTKPKWDLAALAKSSANGVSEMITMLAASITAVVMNNILIRMIGYQAVTAATISFVGRDILVALFLGYASGIAPIISFNFGKQDHSRLKLLFRRSIWIIAATSALSIVIGYFIAIPLTRVYLPAGTQLFQLTVNAFRIGLLAFLFMGFNSFASIMFTALNNGKVSGLLSFFRTLVFILLMLSLLPAMFEITGVWLALPAAELLALGMTIWYFIRKRGVYHYA